jgi:hypothetical protein
LAFANDKGFNGKVSQCIEKALNTLGEGVKQSLYYQMERRYHLSKETFLVNPEAVIESLREFLGPIGSSLVERLIIVEIRKEFKLEFRENLPLSKVIDEARAKFLNVAKWD